MVYRKFLSWDMKMARGSERLSQPSGKVEGMITILGGKWKPLITNGRLFITN